MKIQLLSDLHLESEAFEPEPAAGADVLVLAGDIDAGWHGLAAFAAWPVPVLYVPGNHEFDGREIGTAEAALRERCAALGIRLLHRDVVSMTGADGRAVRFVGAIRWSDFDTFGPAERDKALRAAGYFMRLMAATIDGQPFDAVAMRSEGQRCRAWLERVLASPATAAATVVVTHFAPSLLSADPRYGLRASTAAFCNADDDLIPRADLWLHGHLHCRHDYAVTRTGGRPTRVVCQARGLASKGEDEGFDPLRLIEV